MSTLIPWLWWCLSHLSKERVFVSHFHIVLFRSHCTWTTLMCVEPGGGGDLHQLPGIFPYKLVYSPPFIYLIIPLHQYGLLDIYFTCRVIIQFYFINVLLHWVQRWWLEAFSCYVPSMCAYVSSGSSCMFPSQVLPLVISIRNPGAFIGKWYERLNLRELRGCTLRTMGSIITLRDFTKYPSYTQGYSKQ